ncbi:MAG: DsbA family protein [Halioglobus sp.]
MSEQFQEQGGAATMDPKPAMRWLTSKVMTKLSSRAKLEKKHAAIEKTRVKAGLPHVVEYFHQVEDGYSHLAAQVLAALALRYDIELICHLVSGPQGNNSAEPELLLQLSQYDSSAVAPHYGLEFPAHAGVQDSALVELATSVLAAQTNTDFISRATDIGQALWSGDTSALQALAVNYGTASPADVAGAIEAGNSRRDELKHYSGAMFYYGQEWYWGVDRLYHLEKRLAGVGADKHPGENLLVPRPTIEVGPLKDDGRLTLEVFPSLRSPYTAISFDRALQLAADSGVKLVVRPVLPMVMRGVPATRMKGMYIFADAAREARAAAVSYGNFYDPIGEPVRRCYSLYPWACEQGRGNELLSSFLKAAFARGINTNNDKGLQRVVEDAGLDWSEAKKLVGTPGWEQLLETNREAMYAAGLWGVPSFRLLDENGEQVLALWGQDRLWLFAREIQRLLDNRQ